jgi:RNA polymerase sigma factor (sigma-70 family)
VLGSTEEDAARRKRAAVELIGRDGAALRRVALRYSLCVEDAEDAYQRALEILLKKAPSGKPRDLIRWTQTVVKHEALAIRAQRERLLGPGGPAGASDAFDPIASAPAPGDGPQERTERRERVARSREALQALKPAELRALTLLSAGYSYAEIGELTGFSHTKVNRCVAEGRERFRRVLADSEDGTRCAELRPLLSAHCDGEASPAEAAVVREHLRACAGCRAAMRAYRATPARVAALAPAALASLAGARPASRSLLDRAGDLLWSLQARLPGGGAADSSVAQVAAAGGTRGAGWRPWPRRSRSAPGPSAGRPRAWQRESRRCRSTSRRPIRERRRSSGSRAACSRKRRRPSNTSRHRNPQRRRSTNRSKQRKGARNRRPQRRRR